MEVTYKYLLELYTMIDLININMKLAKKNLDKAQQLIEKTADKKHPLGVYVNPKSTKYKAKLRMDEVDGLQIKNCISRAFAQLEGCANEMANLVLVAESEPENYEFPINQHLLDKIYKKIEEGKQNN